MCMAVVVFFVPFKYFAVPLSLFNIKKKKFLFIVWVLLGSYFVVLNLATIIIHLFIFCALLQLLLYVML